MHFANCAVPVLPAIFFTTLIENLRLCSSAEAGIALNLFLNFEQKKNVGTKISLHIRWFNCLMGI